jgi:flavin-dependent dehydrogenase
MYDLIVVGGGPAGASAAIVAAAAGFQVLLLERGVFPRHKVCGEFVSAESLDLLGNLLDSRHQSLLTSAIRISQTRVFVDGHLIKADIDPAAASIARIDLDAALWASAESCGADARQNSKVENISGEGPFQVKTSVGDFQSGAVINASGRWSNLTAEAGKRTNGDAKWIGIKGHFLGDATIPSVDLYFFEGGTAECSR